nr:MULTISPECIES: UbiA family prenyltransferase [unclassified Laspinema]
MVKRELLVNWLFIKSEIWVGVIPGLIFLCVAWNSQESPAVELLPVLAGGTLYFLLYTYTFCVANQMMGVVGDRLNQRDRPLCRGLISYQGAKRRWIASMVGFAVVGWQLGVFEWTLLWQLCISCLTFGRLGLEWPSKHFFLGLGALAQMAAAWQAVASINLVQGTWILLVAILCSAVVGIQDLSDLEGDVATGVNTFPVTFGNVGSRVILCIGFLLLPLAIHVGLLMPAGLNNPLLLWALAQTLASWGVAVRVILYRSPTADRDTYLLALAWYYIVLGSASAAF